MFIRAACLQIVSLLMRLQRVLNLWQAFNLRFRVQLRFRITMVHSSVWLISRTNAVEPRSAKTLLLSVACRYWFTGLLVFVPYTTELLWIIKRSQKVDVIEYRQESQTSHTVEHGTEKRYQNTRVVLHSYIALCYEQQAETIDSLLKRLPWNSIRLLISFDKKSREHDIFSTTKPDWPGEFSWGVKTTREHDTTWQTTTWASSIFDQNQTPCPRNINVGKKESHCSASKTNKNS